MREMAEYNGTGEMEMMRAMRDVRVSMCMSRCDMMMMCEVYVLMREASRRCIWRVDKYVAARDAGHAGIMLNSALYLFS